MIDYGAKLDCNRDPETGIRYGILPIHHLADWVIEEAEPVYADPTCPWCGSDIDADDPAPCMACGRPSEPEERYPEEPRGHVVRVDGVVAWRSSDGECWIYKSPVIVSCAPCSPCAPGAGWILDPGPIRAYGLPPGWLREADDG